MFQVPNVSRPKKDKKGLTSCQPLSLSLCELSPACHEVCEARQGNQPSHSLYREASSIEVSAHKKGPSVIASLSFAAAAGGKETEREVLGKNRHFNHCQIVEGK